MPNFQKSASDPNSRFDSGIGRLVLMLGESAKIDLAGIASLGDEPEVDVNNWAGGNATAVVTGPLKRHGPTLTYQIAAQNVGTAMLEARVFGSCPTQDLRKNQWFQKPCCAFIQVSVLGSDFKQGDPKWGSTKYGSTNPLWKNVQWTTMGWAGCGPTSLATVLDYLIRLNGGQGVTPAITEKYAESHGRAVKKSKDDQSVLEPNGTAGNEMFAHVGEQWPGYAGASVANVDEAVTWLRAGTPIVFLATGSVQTWKERNKSGVETWSGGHYMVLLGVEDGPNTGDQLFWVSDPSKAKTQYTSRRNLQSCPMWRVYKT